MQYPNGRPDTHFKVPDGTTYVDGAFNYSNNLISIELPDTVISAYGFANCKNLTYVDLGDGLEGAVGGFANCENLTMVAIPRTAAEISGEAFLNCNKLSHIYYSG